MGCLCSDNRKPWRPEGTAGKTRWEGGLSLGGRRHRWQLGERRVDMIAMRVATRGDVVLVDHAGLAAAVVDDDRVAAVEGGDIDVGFQAAAHHGQAFRLVAVHQAAAPDRQAGAVMGAGEACLQGPLATRQAHFQHLAERQRVEQGGFDLRQVFGNALGAFAAAQFALPERHPLAWRGRCDGGRGEHVGPAAVPRAEPGRAASRRSAHRRWRRPRLRRSMSWPRCFSSE
ncbi:hypothetical protein M770_18535 [Pseudomonas aeruginosa VRFPA03]|nr:hypothetical protein M770_18535 [Pseudomonas aeruginosa VRFPA03]